MNIDELIEKKLVHEIHTSERKSFRSCRRRWDWLFRQNYYPKLTAKPLEFGVAYHEAMEVYYEPSMWSTDREVRAALAKLKFVESCETQKSKALSNSADMYLDESIETDYNERLELGKGMLDYYFKEVAPIEDKGWEPVKVEVAFMLPIPNPETGEDVIWCKCDTCYTKYFTAFPNQVGDGSHWSGLPVVYAGRLDMLAEDENGEYWIFDWKTATTLSENWEFLLLDDQIGSYVWALRKLGINVRGFIYHEQRKGYPQAPTQNKARRLGCLFSVAKNQQTDYETYLRTVSREDTEAWANGSYDSFLDYLKNEGIDFFRRQTVHKTVNECGEIENNIGLEALDMIESNVRLYPSAGKFGCTYCAFIEPCKEKNNKGDYLYALNTLFERREHYYVRTEPSTEAKE